MEVFELRNGFAFYFLFNMFFLYFSFSLLVPNYIFNFRISFEQAYQTWLINNKEMSLPGLKYTNEQLFYISFAQVKK